LAQFGCLTRRRRIPLRRNGYGGRDGYGGQGGYGAASPLSPRRLWWDKSERQACLAEGWQKDKPDRKMGFS